MFEPCARCLSIVMAVLLVLPAPVQATSPDITVLAVRDVSAGAEFQYTEGDVTTFVSVTAANLTQRIHPPDGSPTEAPATTVSVFRASSSGDVLISGSALAEVRSLDVIPTLGAARLRATVPFFSDTDGIFYTATVDLTFTATGPVQRERIVDRTVETGGTIVTTRFHTAWQDATAQGSLTMEVVPGTPPIHTLPLDVNLVPTPSTFAVIQRVRTGTLTIQRPPA